MSEEFKFGVGDLVQINPQAFDEQLPSFDEVRQICRERIFTVKDRKVHWYTDSDEQKSVNWCFLPGFDWQGGDGWIAEEWLTKWVGGGSITFSITMSTSDKTKEERETEVDEMVEKIRDIVESMGLPRDSITKVGVVYEDEED